MDTLVRASSQVITCSDHACLNALSDVSLCDCSQCFGAAHGHAHRAGRDAARAALRSRYVEPGFTRSMLAAVDSDEVW